MGPLFMLTGAPASGKTTLLPALAEASRGVVVMDIDELLEGDSLLGVPIASDNGRPHWDAYNRMWRRITELPRRIGHPVLLLSPCTPDEFEGADAWALLDCADDVRQQRLSRRGWSQEQIADALDDATKYRALLTPVFRSDQLDPSELADSILGWCEDREGGRPAD